VSGGAGRRSLRHDEARERAALLRVDGYAVRLDLTGAEAEPTFASRTTIRLHSGRGTTFLDLAAVAVAGVTLDGRPLATDRWREGRLPLELDEGEHELVVDATMPYRTDGEGLHRAVDPTDGRTYLYAMSFLDAAPTIFACFDQPDLKAPVTLEVHAPASWTVLANGRTREVDPGVWRAVETPPVPTYAVTLVAGPYHLVRDHHDGIDLGWACRTSLARHLDEDLDDLVTVTRQSFDELHRLFGIRYPFGDYWQAFVPEFNAGAMENPGCVTFRDQLVFTSRVTRSQRITRATTIAHEMAHQWFGDLVTMRWWDDLWLNESFAEYLGTLVVGSATQYADAQAQDVHARRNWGLAADQRPSTHPVAGTGAVDAAAALADFDGISYTKGGAILRQLHALLGDEGFFGGVRAHLEAHRYGNATMADLVSAWEAASGRDLDVWGRSWLRTADLDRIHVDRGAGELVRTPPAVPSTDASSTAPATGRTHALSVAVRADAPGGWQAYAVRVEADRTPLPGPVAAAAAAGSPVLVDPAAQTWADTAPDAATVAALPDHVRADADPLLRATTWSAIRQGVHAGRLEPDVVLATVVALLADEPSDAALERVGGWAVARLRHLCADPDDATRRLHGAFRSALDAAAPGSTRQLAALWGVVGTASDPLLLHPWVDGRELPPGVVLDPDLRWRLLTAAAALDAVGQDDLDRARDAAPSTTATAGHARASAARPDRRAKDAAWEAFVGGRPASNDELEALGSGLWQRGQEMLTAHLVERYFTDLPGTATVRRGWTLTRAAEAFFPRLALDDATLGRAESLLADPGLDPLLRRPLVDQTDELRRGVRALSASRGRSGGAPAG